MSSQNASSIAELSFFADLDAASIRAMQSIARQYRLTKGEVLFGQEEIAHSFYVVVHGGVRLIEQTPDGKDMNLKIYGPDDVFGLLAVSGEFPHHARIQAAQYSELVAFDGARTRQIMQTHPNVALRVIDELSAHIHHAHNRIREMAVEKTEQRLARALLHFCQKFGESNGNTLSANFSQRDIAEFTGTTIETVNRIFKKWESTQFIQCSRLSILVTNIPALRNIADDQTNAGRGYLVE